ncbi:PucR family transcriptional regulator [Ornithinimicrobium sp. Y1847]|uniref:PucR family transcriptional regulator n=1 Tax=Ornithinimicrobium sp. Y1847 TaxID=3405419 RepID=UPI003B6739DA
METEHSWFRELSADDRSWISVIAQSGIQSLLSWYAAGCPGGSAPDDMFTSAPSSLAKAISLHQALDLTRTAIATVEDAVPDLVDAEEQPELREAVLTYSREIAFTAAAFYARAAERRGRWDARLESLVVHAVVRGEADDTLASRAAELGWESVAGVAVVVGPLPEGDSRTALGELRAAVLELGREALVAVLGPRMICIVGGTQDPLADATHVVERFAPGPVVVGPRVPHLFAAGRSARAAISGADAARAWPAAPRPVAADELLAERALLGEQPARRVLADRVYLPLRKQHPELLDTVQAYLERGTVLEATARDLFLHPNTVRYRLRRVAEVVGLDPHTPRDAWVLQVALALGRMSHRHL